MTCSDRNIDMILVWSQFTFVCCTRTSIWCGHNLVWLDRVCQVCFTSFGVAKTLVWL